MFHSIINQESFIQVYKSFFEYNPEATYAILPSGEFILFNKAACNLTGYTQEEAIGMSYKKMISPDYLEKTRFHFNEALKGNIETFQSVLLTKDGERKTVSIMIVPIIIDEVIKGIIGVTKNITEKIMLETLRNGQNLILEMITKNRPYQEVLDKITLLFEKISTNGGKCSIMVMDETHSKLLVGSAPSLPKEYVAYLSSISVEENTGSCGTAAFSKKIVIAEDIQTDIHWHQFKEIALEYDLRSCWSIPILDNHENVLGTFAIYYNECCKPEEKDLELLKEACYLSAIAIQHYKSREKIRYLAFHDPLTGLPNRRMFNEKLEEVLDYAQKTNSNFSVLFIDLDRFKTINDTYGHNVGDLFLIEISNRIKNCLENHDVIARLGGDEFTILLENASMEVAEKVGSRIIQVLEQPFNIQGIEIFISPSVGISVYPKHGITSAELLKKADSAMYYAKKDGGNTVKFHDERLENQNKERLLIENQLRKALENQEFILHYQPKIDLKTKKIRGVEALIRWKNKELGMVSPVKFIPIAEETGLIIPIGEWVIRQACEQLMNWKEEGICDITVAVNLSVRQFYSPNLLSSIKKIIHETGIEPYLLELEITESMTMDVEVAKEILHELKSIGVKISIDDFGTGYSSLNYLKHFPIDFIKIDKSFIDDLTHDNESENIVNIFTLMAKTFGFQTVAEGVETKEQVDALKKLDCNEVQGYFFSKPLANDDFRSFYTIWKEETYLK